jgi:hypothetical protein
MPESKGTLISDEEALRQSSSRVELAVAELDAARREQEELLAAVDLADNLIATAIAVDALTSKKWGGDPTFTRLLVENMTAMLHAGQPFVIADRGSPYKFVFGDTPADPFLIPHDQGDGHGRLAQADIVYRGNGTSFQIADTRPGRGAFGGYSPNTPPSYFRESELLRAFFGSDSFAFFPDDPSATVAAQTDDKVLITGTEQIGEQFRQLLDLEPTGETLSLIRGNARNMRALGSDELEPARFVDDLSQAQRDTIASKLVEHLIEAESAARRQANEDAYYNPRSTRRHDSSGLVSGNVDLMELFPAYDIPGKLLQTLGKYTPPARVTTRSRRLR